ncbi:cardiolipin synthase [Atopobacter phocae]|uniref:cardiolipin synthase n=1 Tax=Atopobacter phocae TaxID=136492 RepID=UPI00046F608C|nr:cardiolipin synthase [Atopobacter phocae]
MWITLQNIFSILMVINILISVVTVFSEERDIAATWAWLLVLTFIPGVGLILYFFFGRKLRQSRLQKLRSQKKMGLQELIDAQRQLMSDDLMKSYFHNNSYLQDLATLFLYNDESVVTLNNDISIYTDGKEKFESLIKDIEEATDHIHLLYYIFRDDHLGQKILDLLVEKAQEGVEVLVLYDAWGSNKTKRKSFRKLEEAGGATKPFFGSPIRYINFRVNHRNHRKIAIIDGKIGYLGGFNIGDEYLGKGKLGYWRDTHMRITGNAVISLQSRFFVDWNAVVTKEWQRDYDKRYFPLQDDRGNITMQIVTSGPDSEQQIKMGFLKMIGIARKYIYIQTPYFIPDESIFEALKIAINSGVDVRIMIPCKPDHPIVYRATEYYAKRLEAEGATIYTYENGFIHSKMLIVDGEVGTIGTANFDVRSFKLNFEINAFIYNKSFVKQLSDMFINDCRYSEIADQYYFEQQSYYKKFKQSFARLFSPIL